MRTNFLRKLLCLLGFIGLTACSTTVENRRDGPTTQMTDETIRYGSMAGLGAAGFFAGKEIGGSNTAGALGAGTGVVAAYALNKYGDGQKNRAYRSGYEDGADAARSEMVNEQWRREAIYGIHPERCTPAQPSYREVYVSSREIDGVKLQGEYQTVEIVK